MARTAIGRGIKFQPASIILDFLGAGYAEKGLGVASLKSFLIIYPKPSLFQLANLQRKTSPRSERDGDIAPSPDEASFLVVFFRTWKQEFPVGLDVDSFSNFFTEQFAHKNDEEKAAFQKKQADLFRNRNYYILAVTARVFSLQEKNTLSHFIVAALMFQYDSKVGMFVSCLGVTNSGSPTLCSLTPDCFIDDDASSGLLTAPSPSFRSKGLATFLLATLQVLGHIGLKQPRVTPSASFVVAFNELHPLPAAPHHLYLQARVAWDSAYTMYMCSWVSNPLR